MSEDQGLTIIWSCPLRTASLRCLPGVPQAHGRLPPPCSTSLHLWVACLSVLRALLCGGHCASAARGKLTRGATQDVSALAGPATRVMWRQPHLFLNSTGNLKTALEMVTPDMGLENGVISRSAHKVGMCSCRAMVTGGDTCRTAGTRRAGRTGRSPERRRCGEGEPGLLRACCVPGVAVHPAASPRTLFSAGPGSLFRKQESQRRGSPAIRAQKTLGVAGRDRASRGGRRATELRQLSSTG